MKQFSLIPFFTIFLSIIFIGCVVSRKKYLALKYQLKYEQEINYYSKYRTLQNDSLRNLYSGLIPASQLFADDISKDYAFKSNNSDTFQFSSNWYSKLPDDYEKKIYSTKYISARLDSFTRNKYLTLPDSSKNDDGYYILNSPLPEPTMKLEVHNSFSRYKYFYQIDSFVSAAFKSSKEEKIYFRFLPTGFAIATPFEDINKDGVRIGEQKKITKDDSKKVAGFFSNKFFENIRNFFSKASSAEPSFKRFILVLITNKLNTISTFPSIGQLQSWFYSKFDEIPSDITMEPIPNNTKCYVLLYEFKKPENQSEFNLEQGQDYRLQLESSLIYKSLSDGN